MCKGRSFGNSAKLSLLAVDRVRRGNLIEEVSNEEVEVLGVREEVGQQDVAARVTTGQRLRMSHETTRDDARLC